MTRIQQLVILGAGGFGREILAWAAVDTSSWKIKGLLDDNFGAIDRKNLGLPLLGTIDDYAPKKEDTFICAIGQPTLRKKVSQKIKARGGRFGTLVHPTAIVADRARLGEGVVVCPYAIVSVDAQIEEGTAVYYHASIDHDTTIGKWCQISAHCDITGGAHLGDEVFVGSHATILPKVRVGDRAVIGAGSVVNRNVASDSTVFGVPARVRGR